jgi:Ni/Fe-hydrogenase subunit HybB-like protein
VLFLEFLPVPLEETGKLAALRRFLTRYKIVLVILGIMIATLHQSSLGTLFLITPEKLHPLWYSSYLPIYFFVSSIIAGLSMVIVENAVSYRYFKHKMDEAHLAEKDTITLGFGKAAAFVLAGYFVIKVIGIAVDNNWHYLATGYGAWYLVELLGFVALPCFLYAVGVRDRNTTWIRWTAAWSVLGIVVNRFNVSMIAFNWHLAPADRYFPHWMEIGISVFIVTLGLVIFKFIVTRMPVLYEHPEYETH